MQDGREAEGGDVRERLHDKVLDLCDRDLCVLCDALEREHPIVGCAAKDRLDERHQADLLAQEVLVLLKDRLMSEISQERDVSLADQA